MLKMNNCLIMLSISVFTVFLLQGIVSHSCTYDTNFYTKLKAKCSTLPFQTAMHDKVCYVLMHTAGKCDHINGYSAKMVRVDQFPIRIKTKFPTDYFCAYEDTIITCKQGFHAFNSMCYRIFESPKSWEKARNYCNFKNSHLASIHDDSLNQFLIVMAQNLKLTRFGPTALKDFKPMWIGLNFDLQSSQWNWTDGTKVDYYRWWATEKGTSTEHFSPEKNRFVYMKTVASSSKSHVAALGYWGNADGSQLLPFVCEQSGYINDFAYHTDLIVAN